MTNSKQTQSASEGAIAIQSNRDTIIHHGLDAGEMATILDALAKQLPTYAALAREIVDERMREFKDEVLTKFADEKKADPQAFADPDFQYLLTRAQHAYARSGDPVTRDTVIDLIARRSKETQRSRLTLTLNDAIEKSAVLTNNEFAELSLSYFLKYTKNNSIVSLETFSEYCRDVISPLLRDISTETASYQYLVAQSCATIDLMIMRSLEDIFRHTYAGIFSRGFEKADCISHAPELKREAFDRSGILIPCLNNPTKWQLRTINVTVFKDLMSKIDITDDEAQAIWNFGFAAVANGDDLLSLIEPNFPEIHRLKELWQTTPLQRLNLTTVGIAIGNANLVRVIGKEVDLAIWIK